MYTNCLVLYWVKLYDLKKQRFLKSILINTTYLRLKHSYLFK